MLAVIYHKEQSTKGLKTWIKTINNGLKYTQHLRSQLLLYVSASQASCKYVRSPPLI